MDDLGLLPVADFGSFLTDKQQAIRLEFVGREGATPTVVNVLCKTKKMSDDDVILRIEDERSTITLDRLLSHVHSLKLSKTAILSILVHETREEWKDKIVFSLRKLFFLLSNLPIIHLEVGAVHWSVFAELRMDFYSTFKNIQELTFLPDQIPEGVPHDAAKMDYHRTLLAEWLPRIKATLRCLRVYTFLRLDSEMDPLLNKCCKLRSLTIGKLHALRDHPEFLAIQNLDLDGQGMAYSSDDLVVARKVRVIFPAARVLRVVRYPPEMLHALLHGVIVAGGVFDIYTDLYETARLRRLVGDRLEMEMVEEHPVVEGAYVEMMGRNERFRTTVHFYNHRQKRFIE